jgi:hypothetical protein
MPRYYIHIITERERIVDPDGEEFENLALAREEASQSARDLMAEELRCGRFVPSQWRAQIATEDSAVVATIPFASLLFAQDGAHEARIRKTDPDLIARAKATFARARASQREIYTNLFELRENVRSLGEINNKLGAELRNSQK